MNRATSSETPSGPDPAGRVAVRDAGGRDGEALSAWIDGEGEPGAAQTVLAGLLEEGHSRRRFEEWCIVGDAIRSQEVAAENSPALCARIRAALESEPALLAPRVLAAPPRRAVSSARHAASGLAIAAAAAVVVFFAVPQLRTGLESAMQPAALQAAQPPVQGASGKTELASIPGGADARRAGAAKRDPQLDPYLRAHRDYAGAGVMPAAAAYLRFGNEGDR